MTAILTACAVSGFWLAGHCTYAQRESMAACEADRPRIEADMRAHGQVVRYTICNRERGT
jgi:hypothetical protein